MKNALTTILAVTIAPILLLAIFATPVIKSAKTSQSFDRAPAVESKLKSDGIVSHYSSKSQVNYFVVTK